ncbi:MAG: hypothetical protein A2W61_01265 [Deltaproteobacteria bacterium RIFCSPLOWO2_01_44_7]|nr:MAG: hypothetical protein A2W61_01265 [Deltaproteobacteria bacterium RIFCSPLOWO2_01_44_7]
MIYIGLDVHTKQSYFCVMDKMGQCLEHKSMVTTEEGFRDLVRRYKVGEEVKVALESTGISWWIANVLSRAGADVHVVNAYQLKLIAHSKRKTDRYDSKVLADLLRCNGLPPKVYIPTEETFRLRRLLKLRKSFIRLRSRAIVQAKSFMRQQGEKVGLRDFCSRGSWDRIKEERSELGFYLSSLDQFYQCADEQVGNLEVQVKEIISDDDSTLRLLETIPGISLLGGRVLMAAIGDIGRFRRSDQLVSYAGFNPSERSSGEREQKGSISKQGRSELRELLVQGAWAVLRSSRPDTALLKKFFYRVMHKRCSQVAITALARKLLVIAYQVMKTNKPFDSSLYLEKAA